ncbi:hypothetical protein HQ520_00335, partial [bacterium]|nr:hypothetical protein [bacterium]
MTSRSFILLSFLLLVLTVPAYAADWPWPQDAGDPPATVRTPQSTAQDVVAPFLIRRVELGNVDLYARAGLEADTAISFSPDSRLLAVGTLTGRLLVQPVYEPAILWEKQVPEGMVKRVAFSADGRTLWFGEQSADAFVRCLDSEDGTERWRFRLADDIETSAPPSREDLWSVYQLPACLRLL